MQSSGQGFNPLFIGAYGDTTNCKRREHKCPSFNPLFIGAYGDTDLRGADLYRADLRFNPLFIGAYGDTMCEIDEYCRKVLFQSPIHRGLR